MFRIRILSAWVIMTMLFSACADWVNVSPKDEIEADKLFKSENGFKGCPDRCIFPHDLARQLREETVV